MNKCDMDKHRIHNELIKVIIEKMNQFVRYFEAANHEYRKLQLAQIYVTFV